MRTQLTFFFFSLVLMLSMHCAHAQVCNIVATGIAFGNYSSGSNSDSTGNVNVTCSAIIALNVSYTIALSKGNGQFSTRQLKSNANTLNYNIYTNSTRTTIWGDGTSSTTMVSDNYALSVLFPVVRNYTAYGRIPADQNPYVGSYTDTLDVTVVY